MQWMNIWMSIKIIININLSYGINIYLYNTQEHSIGAAKTS